MSQIPITRNYASAVGDWCEKVENRSLLLGKFAFPKHWGDDNKDNSASFWSLMRIADNGSSLLTQKAADLERKANGRNVETDEKRNRLRDAARNCRSLANTKTDSGLDSHRARHTARLLELLRATYTPANLRIISARLEGRLAINLAEGIIQNGGINLDRIFGLPLINGSSIKGVTRSAALEELKTKRDDTTLETFVRVFGATESDWKGDLADLADIDKQHTLGNKRLALPLDIKGAITFLQSTPINDAKIVVDITNVHTPDYYRTGHPEDQSKERPQPNYFPAVERGTEFSFPILLNGMNPNTGLLTAAERWLLQALTQRGLGAKTAAGYGWFTDISAEIEEREKEATIKRAAQAQAEREHAEQKAREEAELEKRRAKKAADAQFDKLTPAEQLASIAADNGQFRQFMEKRFPALSPDEKADVVRWLASHEGNARWLEIKTSTKKPWSQIVPQIHAAKKAAGLKLP